MKTLIVLACFVMIGFLYFAIRQLERAKLLSAHSCVASVENALYAAGTAGYIKEFNIGIWETLTIHESSLLLAAVEKKTSLDCFKKNGDFNDPWGVPLQIAVRRSINEKYDFLVWSNGPDRQPHTPDDITVEGIGPH